MDTAAKLKGCCYVCATVCHRGHDVRLIDTHPRSGFFCDCGSGSERNIICQSLKVITISLFHNGSDSCKGKSTTNGRE